MNGLFSFITEAWDKLTDTAENLAAKAKSQVEIKAVQSLAIATGKVVPFVAGTTTKVVTTVASPFIKVGGTVLNTVFATPPVQTQSAIASGGEQVQYVYESGPAAPPTYLTEFSKLPTLPVDHPIANILPK